MLSGDDFDYYCNHFINGFINISSHNIVDFSHYVLTVIIVREDIYSKICAKSNFALQHPLSSLLATLITCFAGSITASLLLGHFPLAPFLKHDHIGVILILWFFLNFSPFDVAYRLMAWGPLRLFWSVLKEVQRCRKVHLGVMAAHALHSEAYLVMFVIACIQGAGSGLMRVLIRLIYGVWTPDTNEFMHPTLSTKLSIYGSAAFTFLQLTSLPNTHREYIYVSVGMAMVISRILSSLNLCEDVFRLPESIASKVLTIFSCQMTQSAASSSRQPISKKQMTKKSQ